MKTEKAIERIKAFRDYLCAGNPIWDVDECKEAFDIAIAAMEQRWISVSERLPEIGEHYVSEPCIVYCSNGAYGFAELEENIFGQVGWNCERDDEYHESLGEVLAWMPLPEPWKGEPMDDLISRQAAISLAKDICVPNKDGSVYRHRCIDPYDILELPSAQPERKKGRWISSDDFDEYYRCSECRKGETQFYGLYRYCPWCGARMEGEEDG